jgi:hypothetical protein
MITLNTEVFVQIFKVFHPDSGVLRGYAVYTGEIETASMVSRPDFPDYESLRLTHGTISEYLLNDGASIVEGMWDIRPLHIQ